MAITVGVGPFDEFRRTAKDMVVSGLKQLLQTKHLYQSIDLDLTAARKKLQSSMTSGFEPASTRYLDVPWGLLAPNERASPDAATLMAHPPDVKLFCGTCGRVEAFNYIAVHQSASRGMSQVFALTYLCQSCKELPEVFLVRRKGDRITLCGRAPIETVTVPKVIPKDLAKHFSGAIVAHQSGQTLCGIFLLRTLIEQWARLKMGVIDKEPTDQLVERYMASLPADFNSRFPSLRALYGDLSADIHAATGSPELFDLALGQVVEHFDARRIFRLGS